MSKKTVPFDVVTKRWKSDPEYLKEYEALNVKFEVARALIKARMKANLTQADVAERMGTTQSVIARLESGTRSVNLKTLEKYASATGTRLHVTLSAN